MAGKPGQKSTSLLSRTVKNIQKNRKNSEKRSKKPKAFITVERKEEKKVKQKRGRKEERPLRFKINRGLIFISHLPAGFYEIELKKYFQQFGTVTNVRLERSKKTGRSKGYGWIEFEDRGVAKIAAETMNNYILFNRILKAEVVTKKYNMKTFWKKAVDPEKYPKFKMDAPIISNETYTQGKEKNLLRGRITSLNAMIERLREKGIDYSYKPPIPEEFHKIKKQSKKRKEANSPCTNGKYVRINTDTPCSNGKSTDTPVLEIDESDKEIEFMTPPNVIKKKLLVSKAQTSPLMQPTTKKKGNIKKKNERKIAKNLCVRGTNQENLKVTLVKQELVPNENSDFQIKEATVEGKKSNNKKQSPKFSQNLKSLQGKVSKRRCIPPKNKKQIGKFSQKLKSLRQGKVSKTTM